MPELFDVDEPRQPRRVLVPAFQDMPDGRKRRVPDFLLPEKRLREVRRQMAKTQTGTLAYIALAREAEELERQAGQQAPGFGAVLDVPGEIGRGVVRAAAESPAAQAIGSFARGRPYEPRPPTFQPQTGAEAVGAMLPSFISPPYVPVEELAREPGWQQAAMGLTPVISGAGATLPQIIANVRAGQYAAGRGVQRGAGAVGREIVREATPGPSGLVPGSPGFAKVPKGGKAAPPPSPVAAKVAEVAKPPGETLEGPIAAATRRMLANPTDVEARREFQRALGKTPDVRVEPPVAPVTPAALPEAGPGGAPPVEPPKPPVAQAVPPPGEPPKLPTGVGGPGDTEDAMRRFARMVASPTNAEAAEAQRLAWGQEYARRLQNMGQRAKEMVDQGVASEEAAHKAMNELRGAYLRQFNQTDWITGEVRAAMYAKVNRVMGGDAARGILPDKDWPSTLQALDHALEGKIIPDKPGTAGGSAKTRLLRVFADEPEILAVVEQIVNKRKPLKSLVDDTVLAGKPPAPGLSEPYTYPWQGFWRERAEQGFWPQILTEQGSLRSMTHEEARQWWLSGFQEPKAYTIAGTPWERAEQTTLVPKMPLRGPQPETRSPEELKWIKTRLELGMPTVQPSMTPSQLDVDVSKALLKEKKTPFESEAVQDLKLQIALKEDPPVWPKEAPLDPPVDDAFQAMPLITPPERSFIVRVLKEAGLTAMDIGNFIRANRSSVDQSWWRQAAPMIPRAIFDSKYRSNFWAANLRSWAATFSQNAAEESWTRILNHRLFPKYLEMADKGHDFLRHPRLMPGETAARAAEEFGYSAGAKRPIPRLTAALPWVKVSQRGYVTGLNEMTWRIFEEAGERIDDTLKQMGRGEIKPPVDGFDPNREFEDVARFLSIMGGRGPMGRFRQAAPLISAGMWAPRLAVARLMGPSLLASRNKWVRAEAWKNLLSWASFLGSIMFAADQLGWAEVELDSRSSDLGKLRIGSIRVDLTFGQAQYLVLATRLATGSMKSASTGEVTKRSREYILSRALRGKEAPVPGTLSTLAEGREFTGEKVDYSNPAFWARQVAPLAPTQAVEFAQKQGITKGLLAAPLAVVGIDVASYGMPAQWLPDYERYRSYPTTKGEAKSKGTLTRIQFREENPEIDAKLYLAGIVESVETSQAQSLVVELIRENKVNPKEVPGLQAKEFESDERKKLRLWILRALGQSVTPQEEQMPIFEGKIMPNFGLSPGGQSVQPNFGLP